MKPGPVRYVGVGDGQVAYQVAGDGPVDLVYMLGTGNFTALWEFAPVADLLDRLASFSRLILFDRRGTGISDALPRDLPTWEAYTDDLRAVLEAVGSERAAVLASADAGPVALNFAAVNPERVKALILWNSFARFLYDEDYPIGVSADVIDAVNSWLESAWATEELARYLTPEHADDDAVISWQLKVFRGTCTPSSFARQSRWLSSVDARPALPRVQAPTLVFNASEYEIPAPVMGRYVAEHVPRGEFVEVPGKPNYIWTSTHRGEILDRIEEFVTGVSAAARAERVLASVLFTDIVDSTRQATELGDARWKEVLEVHDRTAEEVVERWKGAFVKSTGDGILATFEGPGRAVMAGLELHRALQRLDVGIRAGVHFGEIERRRDGDVGGVGVHVAARVMALAEVGELLCTRTVKELSLGSDIAFVERGVHVLKGVPDEWSIFRVERGSRAHAP